MYSMNTIYRRGLCPTFNSIANSVVICLLDIQTDEQRAGCIGIWRADQNNVFIDEFCLQHSIPQLIVVICLLDIQTDEQSRGREQGPWGFGRQITHLLQIIPQEEQCYFQSCICIQIFQLFSCVIYLLLFFGLQILLITNHLQQSS